MTSFSLDQKFCHLLDEKFDLIFFSSLARMSQDKNDRSLSWTGEEAVSLLKKTEVLVLLLFPEKNRFSLTDNFLMQK